MQIDELIKEIDFHDSSIIGLLHKNNIVQLKIDLCMWRQKGYKEYDKEIKEILLVFDSVTDYIWDSYKTEAQIEYDTILEITYNKGIFKMVLLDDIISVISFKCKTVRIM